MPLSYLYVYDLFFSIPSPSGGDVSAKVRKFFIPASNLENSFSPIRSPRPLPEPQERNPLGFASAKVQLFLLPASPISEIFYEDPASR